MIILFSGPYNENHGFSLFLEGLKFLFNDNSIRSFPKIIFTRIDDTSIARVQQELPSYADYSFYPLLSYDTYLSILKDINVCFVLQSPRLSKTHFPSKIIEYICLFKKVITTYHSKELAEFSEFIGFITPTSRDVFIALKNLKLPSVNDTQILIDKLSQASLIESENLFDFLNN